MVKLTIGENEIRNIIAAHYNVNKDAVVIHVKQEWAGYGQGEHTENRTEATIILPSSNTTITRAQS